MNPLRTYRFDGLTLELIDQMASDKLISKTEVIRLAIRFYAEQKGTEVNTTIFKYMDLEEKKD